MLTMNGRFYHLRVTLVQRVQLVLLGQLVLKVRQVRQVLLVLLEMQVLLARQVQLVALVPQDRQVQPQGSEHQQ